MQKITAEEMLIAIRTNDLSKLPTIKNQGNEWVSFKYTTSTSRTIQDMKKGEIFTPINLPTLPPKLEYYTILYLATKYNGFEFVKALLEKGAKADVNVKTPDKETPLHKAIENKNENIVRELIDAGADLTILDICKNNFLYRATETNYHPIILLLLKKGKFNIEAVASKDPFINRTISYYQDSSSLLKSSNDNNVGANSATSKPTIVWTQPKLYKEINETKEAFIYSSCTKEKIVHIPFTAIHTQLMKANWLMRSGKTRPENYIVAHILFIVSADPHSKTSIAGATSKYLGGRTFIDFPIVEPMSILTSQSFVDRKKYEESMKQNGELQLGKYNDTRISSAHSEEQLYMHFGIKYSHLPTTKFIEDLMIALKSKLIPPSGSNNRFKIYSCQLFINSQRNVCSKCEKTLSDLMDPQGSFLSLLKASLQKDFTLPKSGLPRMLISVSSYDYSRSFLERLNIEAENALNRSTEHSAYLDSKILSNGILSSGVILSTVEKWLDGQSEADHAKVASELIGKPDTEIPFYTGFASAEATKKNTDLIPQEHRDKMKVSLPRSFDGKSIFTIQSEQVD